MKPNLKLLPGKKYKIRIEIGIQLLTFNCEIIAIDDTFVSFRDIYNKEFTYNINKIVSYEVLEDGH